jgi:uncharacterized protein (DUF302 family)
VSYVLTYGKRCQLYAKLPLTKKPTRGNLFLPVRLLVYAGGRGTVSRADSAARAELQGAPKQKLQQLKKIQKYHRVRHKEMLICCFDVSPDM